MSAVEILELPSTGFIRKKTVLKFIEVSSSTWDRWVESGRAPKPVRLGANTAAYRAEDIRALIDKLSAAGNDE
ncbi:hypothetical protein A3765_28405 [Oleiphilus sp. HI0130]|nr:hypothetical protein A3765_28715 [Oleiphilus sp. HI0130]KZZ72474.1 hypothetical protein A3765_28405 [Oleiphilus sp. HI0130]